MTISPPHLQAVDSMIETEGWPLESVHGTIGTVVPLDTAPLGTVNIDALETENSSVASLHSYTREGKQVRLDPTLKSREGHENERYEICPVTGRVIRLVTGCVPITSDGRILLASSKKKLEWGLPKGGWEIDEMLEESAVRETFEEAGVVGVLGDRLDEVVFETRKGKKQRILREELEKQRSLEETVDAIKVDRSGSLTQKDEYTIFVTFPQAQNLTSSLPISLLTGDHREDAPSVISSNSSQMSASTVADDSLKSFEASLAPVTQVSSNKPGKRSHSLCRMVLFPLYVSDILEDWPEKGRIRKCVDIDEAISLMTRNELRDALLEVKRKGCHLMTHATGVVSNST
eukprot:CAMPEP_0172485106 /NCGR_PEP_ID=MMETSP1066-20121228/12918_1 /TAXON_ID=671091 /ORGANISM="Coscinodiscus wailesii, Strain CCMP2513" /LENGTH=345 /DNA_ID=CAMNT_0013250075 /DNA_START=454 /DNA_END=1491 /DNA_ORIENTATION=+